MSSARSENRQTKISSRNHTFVLGSKRVVFTHLDRVYFPASGYTKADVLNYYLQVAPYLLPHLKERPLALERWPEGIESGSFFQKDASPHFPPWLQTFAVPTKKGDKITHYPLVNDEADLLYLVNLGTLTFHTQMSRISDPEHPDLMVIDIDPPETDAAPQSPEAPAAQERQPRAQARTREPSPPRSSTDAPTPFRRAAEVAVLLRNYLRANGLDPLVKTSGKRGLHLAFPLDGTLTYTEARAELGRLFARIAAEHPTLLTTLIRKNKRQGRVYLDALRMSPGATIVPPYVIRATPPATVSMPITWEELETLQDGNPFTIKTAPARLRRTGDLWATLVP